MAFYIDYATGTRTAGTPPEASFTVLGNAVDTTPGVYQFVIDFGALVRGDSVQVQVLEKAKAGSTQRVVYNAFISNAQDEPLWMSESLMLGVGWQLQVKQLTGTARSFDWSIRRLF